MFFLYDIYFWSSDQKLEDVGMPHTVYAGENCIL